MKKINLPKWLTNKKVWIPVIAVAGVAVISFSTVGIASSVDYNEALAASKTCVPAAAELISSERDDDSYEFKFYDAAGAEKYEIEVSRSTKKVKSLKTQLDNDTGAETVTLTEEEAKAVVTGEYPSAQITSIYTVHDDGGYLYAIDFEAADCYGDMEIHAGTGAVLERDVKFGSPIVIPTTEGTTSGTAAESGYLTLDQAREIALQKVPDGTITDIDLDRKNNVYVYEIEIYQGTTEHELTINAQTGEEISFRQQENSWGDYGQWDTGITVAASDLIGADAAKETALSRAEGENAAVTEFELDIDDGVAYYEGEVRDSQYEYDFKINAKTGEVVEWKKEALRTLSGNTGADGNTSATGNTGNNGNTQQGTVSSNPSQNNQNSQNGQNNQTTQNNNNQTTTSSAPASPSTGNGNGNGNSGTTTTSNASGYIGTDAAKQIVLQKIQGQNARIKEIELDRDDGRVLYEGEAIDDQNEYEFEIDAYTGVIVKWESEPRDDDHDDRWDDDWDDDRWEERT